MNEVRIYKPFRLTAKWWVLTMEEQDNDPDPDRLVLDFVVSPNTLAERSNEVIQKISQGKSRVFRGWRAVAARPPVKCLYCGKVTENLNDNGDKSYCSHSCGMNYRYQINKIDSEGKIEKKGRQKKKQRTG